MAAPAAVDAGVRDREEYEEKVRWFSRFLQTDQDRWEKKVKTMLAKNETRLMLDLADLEHAQAKISNDVLQRPVKYLPGFEEALFAFVRELDEKSAKTMRKPIKIGVTGAFGRHMVTPRGLTSEMLGSLVCVEGVVTKANVSTPKMIQSMHYSDVTNKIVGRDHKDSTSLEPRTSGPGGMPKKDDDGNDLVLELGLSVYKDTQKFCIQESPENAPTGQIPRSVEVICEDDLSERAKPGDRVRVVGVYRSTPKLDQPTTNGVWPARIIANSVKSIQKDILDTELTGDDIREIRKISERSDMLEVLSRSFAPSICGHQFPKTGLLLQMVGGVEKNLVNGTHLRGDINVLMVGDPSCGKSQLLRFVMNIAPLAISTTGRGSSGVGLTAAVTREPGSREFNLEAGAMVLADRGIVCIDEFDKMSIGDRVAIHEAMEQQCVTIAKAGMHTTLNARCSVVAAANPVSGNFDPKLDIAKNINLPDSLLSRFDLVFVIRDMTTEEQDRKISSQVLQQCRYRAEGHNFRKRGVEATHSNILERREEKESRAEQATEVWEKFHPAYAGDRTKQILTIDFLRKYIKFCKNRNPPVLSPEASEEIAERYVNMRLRFQQTFVDGSSEKKGKLAVTTRTLESLIRLSTAHAKLKLRGGGSAEEPGYVTVEDVKVAADLLLQAREEPVVTAPEPAEGSGAEDDADTDFGDGGDGDEPGQGSRKRQRRKAPKEQAAAPGPDVDSGIGAQRLEVFRTLLSNTFKRRQQQPQAELLDLVNAQFGEGERAFSAGEFEAGLMILEAQNKIMRAAGTVYVVS